MITALCLLTLLLLGARLLVNHVKDYWRRVERENKIAREDYRNLNGAGYAVMKPKPEEVEQARQLDEALKVPFEGRNTERRMDDE